MPRWNSKSKDKDVINNDLNDEEQSEQPKEWILDERTIYNQIITIAFHHVHNPQKFIEHVTENVSPELYGKDPNWVSTLMEFLYVSEKKNLGK